KQDVLLRPALPALCDEGIPVLEIVMSLNRRGNIIALVQWSSVERFYETHLVLAHESRVIEPDSEQAGLSLLRIVYWYRVCQYPVRAWREYLDLRSLLAARRNELFGVLEISVARDRFTQQPAAVQRTAVRGAHHSDLALRDYCDFID